MNRLLLGRNNSNRIYCNINHSVYRTISNCNNNNINSLSNNSFKRIYKNIDNNNVNISIAKSISICCPFSMYINKTYQTNSTTNIYNNTIRGYHSSTISLGRHTGSKALDPRPREFSKKQEKRKARKMLFKAERIDMRKQKLKDRFFKDQVKSKDTKELFENEKNKLGDMIKSLMLPDLDNDANNLDDMIQMSLPEHITAHYVLDKLKIMKNLLPSSSSSSSKNALSSTISRRTSIEIIDDINNNNNNTIELDYEKCNEFMMELLQNRETRGKGIEMSNIMSDLDIPFSTNYHEFRMISYIKRKQYIEGINHFKSIMLDDIISVNLQICNSFLQCLMKHNNMTRENASKEAMKVINEASPHASNIVKIFLDNFAEEMEKSLIKFKTSDKFHIKNNAIKKVDELFDDLMVMDLVPDSRHWAAVLRSKAIVGTEKGGDTALELLERLKKLNVPTTPSMYSSILEAYVDGRAFDKSTKFWLQMHHVGSEVLTKQAFDVMLRRCATTREVERAFFYMDEMRVLKVNPDVDTFVQLFRACAEAPHWVDGYQDTIFDAMSRMEGAEIVPNTKIYNSIIYAFGRAGDSIAAEFYFWEMRRKGIVQDASTYNSLLNAIGTEQLVYSQKYSLGIKGRFSKPPDEELTEDEKDIVTVGATRVAELYSQGIDQDTQERGSRQKTVLTDTADDNEEYQEAIMDQIRHEAREKRKLLPPSTATALPQLSSPFETRERARRLEKQSKPVELISDNNSQVIDDLEKMEADPDIQALLKEMGQTSLKSLLESDELFDQDGIVSEGSEIENLDPNELNDLLAQFEKLEIKDKMTNKSNKMSEDGIKELMKDMKSTSETKQGGRRREKRSLPKRSNKTMIDVDDETFIDELYKDSNNDSYLFKKKMIKKETVYDRNDNHEEYENPFTEEQFQPPMSLRSHDHLEKEKESAKNEVIDLLDGSDKINMALANNDNDINTNDLMKQLLSGISSDDIDDQWKMIEFGRSPEANYTDNRENRVQSNINKAEKLFQEMKRKNIKPSAVTLTSLMKVYADADRVENAINIFNNYFREYKVPHDSKAYRVLVRMYVRTNDIEKALDLTTEMEQKGVMIDGETYGIVIYSLSKRDMYVKALQLLEEATDKNIRIPNRQIKLLRARCEKLGIVHPNMPDDPHKWIKTVKRVRYDSRNNSKRNIESVKSKLYS